MKIGIIGVVDMADMLDSLRRLWFALAISQGYGRKFAFKLLSAH